MSKEESKFKGSYSVALHLGFNESDIDVLNEILFKHLSEKCTDPMTLDITPAIEGVVSETKEKFPDNIENALFMVAFGMASGMERRRHMMQNVRYGNVWYERSCYGSIWSWYRYEGNT